jgi:tyrosine-protein kinase Etk/Wzc
MLSFKKMLSKFFYHWPLFLAFILISLSINYAYLKYASPVYYIKARLLINNNNKSLSPQSILKETDTSRQQERSLKNQIEVFKSKPNVLKVVKTLNLFVNYQQQNKFSTKDLYQDAPIQFVMMPGSAISGSTRLYITIKDQDSFFLKQDNLQITRLFNTPYTDKIGSWKILKKPNSNAFLGKPLILSLKDPTLVVDQLLKKIEITEASKTTPVFNITISDTVLERGTDILNQMITQYNESSKNEKNLVAGRALKFINKQIRALTGDLDNSEYRIRQLRNDTSETLNPEVERSYFNRFQSNDRRINEVEEQIRQINRLQEYIKSENIDPGNPPSLEGIAEPGMQSLIDQLIELQTQYQRLASKLSAEDAAFDRLIKDIKEVKSKLNPVVNSLKLSLLKTRRNYKRVNSRLENSLQSLSKNERQLINTERLKRNRQSQYAYLMQKREEAGLIIASKMPFSEVVDSAYLDNVKKPGNYAVSLLIGLLIPALLILMKSGLTNKVSTTKQILIARLPILSELTYEYSRSPIVFQPDKKFLIGDQFRALRTDLANFYGNLKTSRITLVTSAKAKEGRSFIASNLAIAMTASGRKTLLLELDYKKPKIAKYFKLGQPLGISDFLLNRASIEQITLRASYSNLFIITVGSTPEELKNIDKNTKFNALMQELKGLYDDILIDGPSMLHHPETIQYAKFADATLYIVRQNISLKKHMDVLNEMLKENDLPKVQVVFNAVRNSNYKIANNFYTSRYTSEKTNARIFFKKLFSRLLLSDQ